MNKQVLQEKGQFQLAFKGNEFVDFNTNEVKLPERTINLSGTYRLRLIGVQATLPWRSQNDQSLTITNPNNGFPLLMLTSPQFMQTLVPDLPGPVFQWGTNFQFAPLYSTNVEGACLTHSNCIAGDLYPTEYVTLIHNRIQLQIRCNDPESITMVPVAPSASAFTKTLRDCFGSVSPFMTFVFSFYYEKI
jgi:hypothetical protein